MTEQEPDRVGVNHDVEAMVRLVMEMVNAALVEGGAPPDQLRPDTNILHDTGLDSMGLAIVVLRLEEHTGIDPFAEGFINFTTIGELAELYVH